DDVEKHEVGGRCIHHLEGLGSRPGREDVVSPGPEDGLEQTHVGRSVVDNQDPRRTRHVDSLQYRRTVSEKSWMSTGLARCPPKQAGSSRSRSAAIANAVRATTGMDLVAADSRRRPSAVTPSKSGSWMSIRMRSGTCFSARAMPAVAVSASSV